jgi:hypothetical protein
MGWMKMHTQLILKLKKQTTHGCSKKQINLEGKECVQRALVAGTVTTCIVSMPSANQVTDVFIAR